ncbi:sushi, von Willebrand factor type A, EGF and pentraxin domain-containing 1-like [Paramuricea clavata]|nr:sushi, von Willebrand factor type A, EGF and pentraxin domain-containing 1-like [Paramuricea clavata]
MANIVKDGNEMYAVGWGRTTPIKPKEFSSVLHLSNDLKQVKLPFKANKFCEDNVKNKTAKELKWMKDIWYFNSTTQFCAGDITGQQDTCHGDSGGPTMVFHTHPVSGKRRWFQVGIVSWGYGCAQKGEVGFYTKVSAYVDWISQIAQLSSTNRNRTHTMIFKYKEKCSDPSGNTNANVIGKEFYHGKEVEFVCPRDSILVPARSKNLTCQDGQWRGTIPSCKASCPSLTQLSDGYKSSRSRTHGSSVQFRCSYGNKLVGSARVVCNDGRWSNQMPKCLAMCNRIRSTGNGWVYGRGNLEGDKLSFRCRTDYILDGEQFIKCTGNRRWNATKPTCRAPCRKLNARAHSRITKGGFRHKEDIKFQCNPDYYLHGSNVLTCSDGTWNGALPTCLEKCSDPSGNTNANVIGKEFFHGKKVEFVCPRDSILVPASSRRLTCQNGQWRGTIPSCKASCPSLPQLSDGSKSSRSQTHGSSVQFHCSHGHKLVGSARVVCNDGRWSNQMPKCLAICNTIRSIGNGWVYGRGNLEGDKLSFRCRTDYILDGEQFIKCTGNRRWNATKPTCRAPCRKLNARAHSRITKGGFRHNEDMKFECDPDYYLHGRNVLTCSGGTWNGAPPTCLAPCRRFGVQPFRGGYIRRDGYRHNEEVTFGCRDPLVIDGQVTLRCNDGTWNSRLPTCGDPCRKLPPPRNGVIITNGYKHKETLTFGCDQGFQIQALVYTNAPSFSLYDFVSRNLFANFGVQRRRINIRCTKSYKLMQQSIHTLAKISCEVKRRFLQKWVNASFQY